MDQASIGIVGAGMVGHAMARTFMEHGDVRVYDVVPEKRTHTFEEAVTSDFVFFCLPTPMMDPDNEDYRCDLRVVDSVLSDARKLHRERSIYVLRSTVPPGTTNRLALELNLPLVYSPEFLTARAALVDSQTPSRNLVGYVPHMSYTPAEKLTRLYRRRFPGVFCFLREAKDCEAAKLAGNAYFALKVAAMNELYRGCRKLDCDWNSVREMLLADGRIAHAHTAVPGPDGLFGFGGACLPKDLQNLIHSFGLQDEPASVFESAWFRNIEDRGRAAMSSD